MAEIDIEKLAREAGATFYRNRHVEKPSITFVNDQLRAFAESYHQQRLEGVGVEPVAWMTDDGRVASAETKLAAMAMSSRAAFHKPLHSATTVAALQERIRQLEADAKLRPISEFGELQAALERIKVLEQKAARLWMLLDDIDTADDIAKTDDAIYRKLAQKAMQKRWEVMTGDEVDAALKESSNG